MADTPKVQSLDDVLRWLDRLERATQVRSTTEWKMQAVLEHLAQSIEMSLDGFPQPKPAWFQATVGAAAFAVFSARGKMSHGLTEPIAGAPEIAADQPLGLAVDRMLAALQRFDRHQGALAAHFAYGKLDKAAYLRAHLMHLADHWQRVEAA